MRIAHVITRMVVGGAQENTLFTCQDLIRDHGDDVLLITGPALGPEGDLLTQGQGEDVPVEYVSTLRRDIHPWRDTRSYFAIKKILRSFRPDVVHTHSAKGGFLGRLAASSLELPAIIHTVHGAPFHSYQSRAARWILQRLERYAAKRCHALVSVANAMTELLVGAHVAPREKFTTVYSGMDVEPFLRADEHRHRVRAELGFTAEDIVVGKIARLFHMKGHDFIITAAAIAAQHSPHIKFLFVGDGILREKLEIRIRAAGIEDRVYFTGLVPPATIPELVGAMDMVVHTSLHEGLPRALPQALLAGKPAIAYDIDGAREVVITGETGVLLEPKSIDPLAKAMITIAADDKMRVRLGNEGRRRFTEQFRHQHMTNELRKIYLQFLNK